VNEETAWKAIRCLESRVRELEAKNDNLLKVASLASTTIEKADKRIKVLEDAAACGLSALKIASRQLTEDMKLVLNGKRWGGSDIDRLEKALGIKSSALEVKP